MENRIGKVVKEKSGRSKNKYGAGREVVLFQKCDFSDHGLRSGNAQSI